MFLRVSKGFLVVICLIFALIIGGYFYLKTSLQKTSGSIKVSGISDNVNIVRDENAVPHIYGTSVQDTYFALGYTHAQDRLWQLEMQKRIGRGSLSEILGSAALEKDKFLRAIGVYRKAQDSYEYLSDEIKEILNVYTAGINTAITNWEGSLPPEFLILGVKPDAWTPADTISWVTMMAYDLGSNWEEEILRAKLMVQLPEDYAVEDLMPQHHLDTMIPLSSELVDLYRDSPMKEVSELKISEKTRDNGSNAWVVSGELSATGMPLLGNDVHLSIKIPSTWYAAHLIAPSVNMSGATLPGVPGIVLGHNNKVAWSITNASIDTQDLYIEKINPDNPNQYLTPDGWKEFVTREEIIKVKGEEDVVFIVRETRHGPIISNTSADINKVTKLNHAISFSWSVLFYRDLSISAFLAFPNAKTVFDIERAVENQLGPALSVISADTKNNIAWHVTGYIPIRKEENDIKGLVPAPGWDPRYDWEGYIPTNELPRSVNPKSKMLFNANHRVTPDNYPYYLSSQWKESYRVERLENQLKERPNHSFASFRRIQNDIKSEWVAEFLPFLLKTSPSNAQAEEAIALLGTWDGEMLGSLPQPLVFSAWYREFIRQVAADELDDVFDDYWDFRPRFMHKVIHGTAEKWCDDVGTATYIETCLDQSAEALTTALNDLSITLGKNVNEWKWEDKHFTHHTHLPLTNVPQIAWFFDRKQPFSNGGPFTIMRTRHNLNAPKDPFAHTHGPSFRTIFDLNNLNRSEFVFSSGQSGNPLSPNYFDMAELWANGDYIKLKNSISDITAGMVGILTLTP